MPADRIFAGISMSYPLSLRNRHCYLFEIPYLLIVLCRKCRNWMRGP